MTKWYEPYSEATKEREYEWLYKQTLAYAFDELGRAVEDFKLQLLLAMRKLFKKGE